MKRLGFLLYSKKNKNIFFWALLIAKDFFIAGHFLCKRMNVPKSSIVCFLLPNQQIKVKTLATFKVSFTSLICDLYVQSTDLKSFSCLIQTGDLKNGFNIKGQSLRNWIESLVPCSRTFAHGKLAIKCLSLYYKWYITHRETIFEFCFMVYASKGL